MLIILFYRTWSRISENVSFSVLNMVGDVLSISKCPQSLSLSLHLAEKAKSIFHRLPGAAFYRSLRKYQVNTRSRDSQSEFLPSYSSRQPRS